MNEKFQFEKALEDLEKIVEAMEGGELTLDQALKKYEEGVKLAQSCSSVLNEAQRKVDLLTKKDGKYSLEKFEDSGEGK